MSECQVSHQIFNHVYNTTIFQPERAKGAKDKVTARVQRPKDA